MQISFFLHVWEKVSKVIFFKEFLDDVRGPRWEVLTKSYRDFLRRGMIKEAGTLKSNMMAVVMAGVFKGGHAAAQICSFSQLMVVDFDHSKERTEEIKQLFSDLPYMVAAFITISGEGLKAVVRVDVTSAEQYAVAYGIVAAELSRLADFPYDRQCCDLGRPCFGTYDPDAYFNPNAEAFPWQDFAPQAAPELPVSPLAGAASEPIPAAVGFMIGFLNDFERRNSFVKGCRNDFLLKLGRAARYKEFSFSEFQILLGLCVEKFAKQDISKSDVEKRVSAGYQFVDSGRVTQKASVQAHQAQGSPSVTFRDQTRTEEEEELLEKSETLREEAPCFPDDLFERLPSLLAEGVRLARNPRERDMLLMGMLANVSGCLPGVQILYDQTYCSMHFYFTAIAQAGSGKGVLALAALLPNAIHRHYERQNQQATREYKEALLRWELECQRSSKAKQIPDLSLSPDEPRLVTLKVSPNISKSRLILYLEGNAKLGVIINATELDMVSGAIRQDCGKHDDVFRAAFQHEEVSSDYKVDGRQVMAHEPHLACCFAGTPAQLPSFIASMENGLFSRIGFYTCPAAWCWRSASPRKGGVDFRSIFEQLSERLLEMHLFLLQSPTEVVFTPEQWAIHTNRFGRWLTDVVAEKEDSSGAIVLRHGLITIRIAGILTALRKCDCAFAMPEYGCTDEDFTTAMQIAEVLLDHSLLLSSSLPGNEKPDRPLRAYYRLRPVFAKLNKIFTYSEFMKEARLQELPESTAKRLLSKSVKLKIVEKENDNYRKIGKRWLEK